MTTNGDAITALQEAVINMQKELGISPSTVYSNVRSRLDVLEKRAANQLVPSPNSENPFIIGVDGVTIRSGDGAPSAIDLPGSLYLRSDGYVYEGLYARRVDNQWHRIDTDPWVGSGDLSGDYASQTVIGIQGNEISTASPEDGYHLTWDNLNNYWEPQIGFAANDDLSGTKISQTVIGIQGRNVDSSAPNNNDIYLWNSTNSNWEPTPSALIFDQDSGTEYNIRANRLSTQSPIDNTKTGIINLSSDSDLSTTGITNDYSSILGGDRNQISTIGSSIVGGIQNLISLNNYGIIGGGQLNKIYSSFSAILGGSENIINTSAHYSSIVGGEKNVLNGNHDFIGDGYQNSVSGNYSTIINGNTCNIGTSLHGTILTGNNNNISAGSDYSLIASGNSNTLDGICSSIICGNFVTINSNDAIVLHGSNLDINNDSDGSVVLGAENGSITGYYSLLFGSGNTISTSGDGYATIINGSDCLVSANYSLTSGKSNTLSAAADYSVALGNSNTINNRSSLAFGEFNLIDSPNSVVLGKYGHAKFNSQVVHSALAVDSLLTLGSAQKSETILDGYGASGSAFNMYIPETLNHLTLDDNKSYDITLRTLIVTTSGTYACARFIHNILAHVDGGNIIIDDTTLELFSDSGAPANVWSLIISSSTDELIIQLAASGVEDRKAISTLECREILRT